MKLNEFTKKKTVTEIDASHLIGSYGASALRQVGNRIIGDPKGQMSVKDRMAQDTFIRDFVGRTSANLASGIEGGLVNPNPTRTVNPTNKLGAKQQTPTPTSKTPDQVRKEKQAVAATTAQAQMAGNPVPPKAVAPAPLSPGQVRQQKQATAATAAQGQMTPKPVTPTPKTPAQIRQEKQAAAMKGLQGQMAESVMGVDEARVGYPDTISTYIQKMFSQYMQGAGSKDPKTVAKVKQLADLVMNTYARDRGKAALTQLANLAFAVGYSHAGTTGVAGSQAPKNALDAITQGVKKGLGAQSSTQGTSSDTVNQALKLAKNLDPAAKQKLVGELEKETKTGEWTGRPKKPEPITIGKQKIMPNDPKYAEIMKNQPVTAESKSSK